eukprot:11530757-Prorocentrum_lima.AAC.1
MMNDIRREWHPVMESLKEIGAYMLSTPVCDFEWSAKHWAAVAGRDTKHLPSRFTAGIRGKALVESFGSWFRVSKRAARA